MFRDHENPAAGYPTGYLYRDGARLSPHLPPHPYPPPHDQGRAIRLADPALSIPVVRNDSLPNVVLGCCTAGPECPANRLASAKRIKALPVQSQMNLAPSSANMASLLVYGISLPARSGPLVTADRRILGRAGRTSLTRTGGLGCGAMADDKADLSSPGGLASPGPGMGGWRVLELLGEAECMELLASGRLGRLFYTSRYGPTALPVTYRIDEGSVVLGTWDPSSLTRTCVLVSRRPTTRSPWKQTRSMWKRVRGGSCWCGERRIIWIPRPSACRSPMLGSSHGSKGYLRTSSG